MKDHQDAYGHATYDHFVGKGQPGQTERYEVEAEVCREGPGVSLASSFHRGDLG